MAGAEPGDTLQVQIERIELQGEGAQGVIPGGGVLDWPRLPLLFHPIEDGAVVFPGGLRLPIAPMIGCIGVAPGGGPIARAAGRSRWQHRYALRLPRGDGRAAGLLEISQIVNDLRTVRVAMDAEFFDQLGVA